MLSTMRKNLKSLSWTLWLVILAFIGFIFVEWGAGRMDKFGGESDLLSINGEIIKGEDFSKNLFQTLESYKLQFKDNFNVSLINQLRLPEQILQNIINKTIIYQEASQLNINASNQELKNKIVTLPGFQRNGEFIGVKEYERFLAYRRINISEFENDIKNDIIIDKFKQLITNGLVIDDHTLWREYQKEKDNAETEYMVLKPDSIKQQINTPENALRNYYNQNKKLFKSPEKRSGSIIFFKYEDLKKEINIPRQELYDYFTNNKKMFISPEKIRVSRLFLKYNQENRDEMLKKAENIVKELNPSNFAAKVKDHSQDEKATNGGDWGYWEWKNLSSQELSFIKNMRKKEISALIDTLNGFSVILISEKTNQKQDTFDEAKDRIKEILEREKSYLKVKDKLNKIYKKLDSRQDLRIKAKEIGVRVIETELLAEGTPVKEIDAMGAISKELFDLKKNQIAFPVELRQGMAILQLLTIKESAIEDFENIKESVKEKYIRDKKMTLLMERAKKIKKTLEGIKNEKPLSQYLKQNNLSFEDFSYKRGNRLSHFPEKKDLDEIIFSLNKNQCSPPIQYDSEIAIIRLKTKNVVDKNEFETNKVSFYQTKIEELKDIYFSTYIMKKRNNSEIQFNQESYKKIKDYVISRF
ncbi:MAG: SurA N-terminal domain-containing protein [Candidatus Aminicenantes bacterium]|nr:SurA N-terminal domain-containing protein [Candidatus Aminicenantes bacterium]